MAAIAATAALWLGGYQSASADVPSTISFSARIADGGMAANGAYAFRFRLFPEAQAGTALWQEGQITLTVNQGVLVHALGSESVLTPDLLAKGPLFLELEVNGVTMSPRIALRSVPYAVHAQVANSVPRAEAAPATCDEAAAGRIYFDTATKRFLGCDGTAWADLSPHLPKRLRGKPTASLEIKNTDGLCGLSAGSPWTNVPGLETTVTVARTTEIEVAANGSIIDFGAPTTGLHCALRFVVDGTPVAGGDPHWGHVLWARNDWTWSPLGTQRRATLQPGEHRVSIQVRAGFCPGGPANDQTGHCYIDSREIGLALDVVVP